MAVILVTTIQRFFGLSTDTKPTAVAPGCTLCTVTCRYQAVTPGAYLSV